jgi:hypothetical protein
MNCSKCGGAVAMGGRSCTAGAAREHRVGVTKRTDYHYELFAVSINRQ